MYHLNNYFKIILLCQFTSIFALDIFTDGIGSPNAVRLDLSGGIGGVEYTSKTYTVSAENVVITASHDAYSNNAYDLLYLFDGQTYPSQLDHNTHWMTGTDENTVVTLDIDFTNGRYISHIVVAPIVPHASHWVERRSNYAIEARLHGEQNYIRVTDMIDTKNDHFGKQRAHAVEKVIDRLRFYLTREGNYGVTLNEIEIYVPPK
eukprot:11493_1